MLDIMRRHARNWLMKLILGIIIVVFVFYFGSMGGRQRAERIAIIDGKPIVYADFQREYQNLIDVNRQRFGQNLTEEMLKGLNLKRQALDNLVNQAVIMKKAEEMNIQVTDDDVKAVILSYPAFQRNGVFDQRIYEQTLRASKMAPEEFEDIQKKMLVTVRLEDLIQDGVKVSDQEALDLYRMQNEKINIEFIQISLQAFAKGIRPAPADLEAFLKAHEGQYSVPEQVQIKYLEFMGQDYAAKAKISDAEINEYYEKNKSQWKKGDKAPPLAEVRDRITTELGKIGGMYAASDEAKKAHDTIYQEENFEAYAAQKKLTPRTTGLFRLNEPPPEFKPIADFVKIVSRLEKQQISRVLQGEKGYYIVQVISRKAPYLPALKEIETEVEKQYREAEAKRLAKKEADDLIARLKKGGDLEGVAGEKGLKVSETGLFQPGGAVPKMGSSVELTEALFQISEKKPYPEQAYWVDGNYVILKFKARGKVDDAEFVAQKDAIVNYLARTKKTETIKAWIEGSKAALVKDGRLEFTRDFKDLNCKPAPDSKGHAKGLTGNDQLSRRQ
ncbi:MAG: SurA N-terminal domain-containing protein [Proteobacteria bacterium]|nr:SurA N-terminal domain-containing protein [Pseudomonadota bacterium]